MLHEAAGLSGSGPFGLKVCDFFTHLRRLLKLLSWLHTEDTTTENVPSTVAGTQLHLLSSKWSRHLFGKVIKYVFVKSFVKI